MKSDDAVLMTTAAPVTHAPTPTATARPTGVTILAVLDFLAAVFLVIAGIMMFAGGAFIGSMLGDAGGILGAAVGAMMGVVFLVFAALSAAAGYGLWTGKAWGWWLALVFAALGVVNGLITLFGEPVSGIIGILISGFIVWYLTNAGVQRYFGTTVNVPWHKA